MKNTIFALLSIVFICSCSNDTPVMKRFDLTGPVKSVKYSAYETVEKFGEIVQGNYINDYRSTGNHLIRNKQYLEFDKDGRLSVQDDIRYKYINDNYVIDVDENDSIISQHWYENKNLIKYVGHGYTVEYTYNADNTIKQDHIRRYYKNELTDDKYGIYKYYNDTCKVTTYNADGSLTGEYIAYFNGKINGEVNDYNSFICIYDDKNLLVESTSFEGLFPCIFSLLFWEKVLYI